MNSLIYNGLTKNIELFKNNYHILGAMVTGAPFLNEHAQYERGGTTDIYTAGQR